MSSGSMKALLTPVLDARSVGIGDLSGLSGCNKVRGVQGSAQSA